MVRVWLPVVYDAFEMLGMEKEAPDWLENSTLAGWVKTIVLAAVVFFAGIGIGAMTGMVPLSPAEWLPIKEWQEFLEFFMIAVTIIVVAVPEGLAMSVTLSLAYSMRKMIANNTLVRRMHACETIGAATVICSDKTGTLTANEMRVFSAEIPSIGNKVKDDKTSHNQIITIESIAINTTANLGRENGKIICAIGQPTECALLTWLDDNKVDYFEQRARFDIEYQLTFSTERKFMATYGYSQDLKKKVLYVKGAPEIVLKRCAKMLAKEGPTTLPHQAIMGQLIDCQKRGMRTLGLAYREMDALVQCENVDKMATDLVWIGFMAIDYPIRPDVPEAIRLCKRAGIDVKMITGDISETALEIAVQSGLISNKGQKDIHMTGIEFAALSNEEARAQVEGIKILSRARPMDKLRMVSLLKEKGHVVAVTGDGINDAPALNYSNVGLAMGKNGADVAKEASDIILLDDSFTSITHAVMWGRSLYKNIQRFILFQLTVNVAALGIALLGPFIGVQFPLTVTQLLWVNLIMDTLAALALASEPAHREVMLEKPRDAQSFIISSSMMKNILITGLFFLVVMVVFLMQIQQDGLVTPYELTIFFTTFVMLQFWNLFNARSHGSATSAFTGLFKNRGFLVVATAIFIGQIFMVTLGGEFFRTIPLSVKDWAMIVGATSLVLWLGEALRFIQRQTTKATA